MKKTISYPATFILDNQEGGYVVNFPDLPGCITQGDSYKETIEMAKEALSLYLEDDLDNVKKPSTYEEVLKSFPHGLIVFIDYEYEE